jgi:hypothetical protein
VVGPPPVPGSKIDINFNSHFLSSFLLLIKVREKGEEKLTLTGNFFGASVEKI